MLPGIGPIATIAMLLPLTFHLEPVSGLIMLAGIFYGAQYGGSTTAILVNLPGETSSVVTCIDGYQMARQGRAGSALAIAALGSFFAGTVATAIIAMFAPPLASVGQSFGAPEYFSLMVLGLIGGGGAGARLGDQGDRHDRPRPAARARSAPTGKPARSASPSTSRELSDGIGFAVLAIGMFGVGEIITNLTQRRGQPARS